MCSSYFKPLHSIYAVFYASINTLNFSIAAADSVSIFFLFSIAVYTSLAFDITAASAALAASFFSLIIAA